MQHLVSRRMSEWTANEQRKKSEGIESLFWGKMDVICVESKIEWNIKWLETARCPDNPKSIFKKFSGSYSG